MIVTDEFVVLNFAKTGSTFVRTVLKRIHRERVRKMHPVDRVLYRVGLRPGPYFKEIMLPRVLQHGTYRDIPDAHRSKRIVSVVRDPYARFVSEYTFRWWASHPEDFFSPDVVRAFPRFPALSFDEYARIRALQIEREGFRVPVGPQTIAFVRMFFREPERVLAQLDDRYLDSDRFVDDLPAIVYLRTEKLGLDLHAFLQESGFPEDEIAFVPQHERINVTKREPERRGTLWTPETLSFVRDRERLLFRILAYKGFEYAPPLITQETGIPPEARGTRADGS